MDKSPQNEGIFERSLSISMLSLPPQSRHKLARTLSNCSLASNGYAIPTHHNTEDFVAPVLDTATEILYNPKSDLNNVNIVCCYENDEEEECDGSCTEKDSDDDSTLNQLKLPNQQQHHHHHHHHHPKKPRSRSRSRSSICKSLMSSLSNTAAGLQSQTFPLSAHSNGPTSPSVRSSKSNVSLPQHQHPRDLRLQTLRLFRFIHLLTC